MDNKFIPVDDAGSKICPMNINEMHSCEGDLCMWWKWTGTKTHTKTVVEKAGHGQFREGTKKVTTFTHGCCGKLYPYEIQVVEMN